MSVARTKHNFENGITLIELVVTLTVVAIIAGFIGRPLINLVETKLSIDKHTEQQADIEYALSRISNEIRFGLKIDCTVPNSIKIGSGKSLVVYKYENSNFVVQTKNPDETNILVGDIRNSNPFSCVKPSSQTPNLYELTLISSGRLYMVRAYQRQ